MQFSFLIESAILIFGVDDGKVLDWHFNDLQGH